MAGVGHKTPWEAFELNMDDAHLLVDLAEALDTFRVRRMRRELRERVGAAIGLPKTRWDDIDCIESEAFFLLLKPDSGWERTHLQDRSPLLRQAVVAGAAAFETYMADKVEGCVREIMRGHEDFPSRLGGIEMTTEQWRSIQMDYQYRWRGITEVVIKPHLREVASCAPSKVGLLLSMVGFDKWAQRVDNQRKLAPGSTVAQLEEFNDRRNQIAHSGDRRGNGRAVIHLDWTRTILDDVVSIAGAIEELV